ncbi:hypothetical protein JCM5296_005113 [Sporobolomyces johnsonii]
MESTRAPRLRRKSSAFKLSLSRQSLGRPSTASSTPTSDDHHFDLATFAHPAPSSSSLSSRPSLAQDDPTSMAAASVYAPSVASTSHLPLLPSNASLAPSTSNPSTSPSNPGPGVGSVPNVPSASLSSTLEVLRQLVGKRITAWTYLKNAGEGKVYWFNTVLLTTDDMRTAFANDKMRNRTTRFAVLGMSLSSLLEITPAHDFLRGLLSLVQEFEAVPEERFGGGGLKGTQKGLFKLPARSRKSGPGSSAAAVASGGADFSMGLPQEGGEASYLFTPNIPFELDYFQVLITTCEMLVETYAKIYSYLGPSAAAASSSSSTAAAGLFPQPPGSSRSGATGAGGGGGGGGGGTSAGAGSVGLSQALAEVVVKIDARLKKLISLLSKEIDTLARAAIKAELDHLGGGVEGWGFDGGEA